MLAQGKLTADQLKSISQTSRGVLSNMGPQIQWMQSYLTSDKFIVFILHQMKKWFANTQSKEVYQLIPVSEGITVIDPTTAE